MRQAQRTVSISQRVAWSAPVRHAHAQGNPALVGADVARLASRLVLLEAEVKNLFLLAPEQGQNAVGRQLGQGLGEIEVVRELGSFGFLALANGRGEPALAPVCLPQLADKVGVLGEALEQDGAGTLQRRVHRGDALLGINKGLRRLLRIALGVGEQGLGQGLQAGFTGDLGLGAPLGLVGQIKVLKPRLGLSREDLAAERIVELALALDAREDGRAPLLQLAQVAQALVERAQLRVVEGARGLLAVARDEGDRGAAVEQVDGSLDLPLLCIQLACNLL